MTAEYSSNSMKKVNAASEKKKKKLQRHNTEAKTGLETNDKSVFSGTRISPTKLNLKHKLKNK